MKDHSNLSASGFRFAELLATEYQILPATGYTVTQDPNINFGSVPALAVYSITVNRVGASSFESDASYWVDREDFFGLLENTPFEIPINITCLRAGTDVLTHTIGSYEGHPAPQWVKINSKDSKLVGTAPSLVTDTTFLFSADAVASSAGNLHQKPISIEVKACRVTN